MNCALCVCRTYNVNQSCVLPYLTLQVRPHLKNMSYPKVSGMPQRPSNTLLLHSTAAGRCIRLRETACSCAPFRLTACSFSCLQYDPSVPSLSARFSNQPGVNVSLPDYGQPLCAPYYQPLFYLLQLVGYTPGRRCGIACLLCL